MVIFLRTHFYFCWITTWGWNSRSGLYACEGGWGEASCHTWKALRGWMKKLLNEWSKGLLLPLRTRVPSVQWFPECGGFSYTFAHLKEANFFKSWFCGEELSLRISLLRVRMQSWVLFQVMGTQVRDFPLPQATWLTLRSSFCTKYRIVHGEQYAWGLAGNHRNSQRSWIPIGFPTLICLPIYSWSLLDKPLTFCFFEKLFKVMAEVSFWTFCFFFFFTLHRWWIQIPLPSVRKLLLR